MMESKSIKSTYGSTFYYQDTTTDDAKLFLVELENGIFKEIFLTRENAPAIEYNDGDREWWINGLRHREDGPAIEYFTINFFEFWLNGKTYSLNEWCKATNKSVEEITHLKLRYNIT